MNRGIGRGEAPRKRPGTSGSLPLIIAGIIVVLVLVLLGSHTLLTARARASLRTTVTRMEARWGSFDPATLAPPSVPDAENRALPFVQAFKAARLSNPERGVLNRLSPRAQESARSKTIPASSQNPGEETVAAIVERHWGALELLYEGSRRARSNYGIDYGRIDVGPLPDLRGALDLALLARAHAFLALDEGNHRSAIESLSSLFALSKSFSDEPALIIQLVRVGIDRVALDTVREILTRSDPAAYDLDRLRLLVDGSSARGGVRAALIAEMKWLTALAEEGFRALPMLAAKEPTAEEPGGLRPVGAMGGQLLAYAAQPITFREANCYLLRMEALLNQTEPPLYARQAHAEEEAGSSCSMLMEIAMPNLKGALVRGDFHEARVDLAGTAIALRRYRRDEGSYPDGIEALVPRYLSKAPIDPFTGRSYDYQREGSGFQLQSAGADPKYDEGTPRNKLLTWRVPL